MPSALPSAMPSDMPFAMPSTQPSDSPSALPSSSQPSLMPSAPPTSGLVYTYNANAYSTTGHVVLGFKASMEASCCLCTEAATAAFVLAYKDVIKGEIKVELIRCTET